MQRSTRYGYGPARPPASKSSTHESEFLKFLKFHVKMLTPKSMFLTYTCLASLLTCSVVGIQLP